MNDIITQGNVSAIIASTPTAYEENRTSMQRCCEYGSRLLQTIQQRGMDDELDAEAAKYLERSRKTSEKMFERRSAVTRLFDDIRKEFTALESAIDPTKAGTIPNAIKGMRNEYAKEKYRMQEEENARRRREAERKNAIEAKRMEIVRSISEQFSKCHISLKNWFDGIVNDSMSGAENKIARIESFESLNARFNPVLDVQPSDMVDAYMMKRLYHDVCDSVLAKYREEMVLIAEQMKTSYLNVLRSNAPQEVKEQHTDSVAAETMGRVQEIAAKEEEKSELLTAFISSQSKEESAKNSAKISYSIELIDAKGILPIISEWWTREGFTLSVEELCKIFKKQINYMERLAKKEGFKIDDPNVVYHEEVKAK